MRAKKARTEIRQEQIAQAAMRLLALRGWQRISLSAIAKESPAILWLLVWLLGEGEFDLKQQCEYAWDLFASAIRPIPSSTTNPK